MPLDPSPQLLLLMQVRHNEHQLNIGLSGQVRWSVNPDMCDQPHTKANLLFQAHFSHVPLPVSDYITDTKLTLDNAIRLLQAMIDTVASQGWFGVTQTCIHIVQVCILTCSLWFFFSRQQTVLVSTGEVQLVLLL